MPSTFEIKLWCEFFIGDLGEILSGALINDVERIPGDTPYVSATSKNNGVGYFVGNINGTYDQNCLSINRDGSVGYAFYHPYPCVFSESCRRFRPVVNSKNIGIFLSNQIADQRGKYSYGYKMGTARIRKQKILLPVDAFGQPDWQFMEQYSSNVMERKRSQYIEHCRKELAKLQYQKIEALTNKQWEVFFLKDIFNFIQRGKRLTKASQVDGAVPYVSSTSLNNGVDNYIGNQDGVRMFSRCLTIANSGSVGASFYHPYEFVASDHVTGLQNDAIDAFVYLFISVNTSKLSEKYNFNREINDNRISREKIMLPIDEYGEPDYQYMRQYMMNLALRKRHQYLDHLEASAE